MDAKAQNFDSRTLALLNRLASRRQGIPTTPGTRPDSAKVDASAILGIKGPMSGGSRATGVSQAGHRVPVDLSGKGSANQVQRPTSAARIQHFQLQGKQADRLGQGAAGGAPGVNGNINIQGRLLNIQLNRDGSVRASGDHISPNVTLPAGFGRLGTAGGQKLGCVHTSITHARTRAHLYLCLHMHCAHFLCTHVRRSSNAC